MFQSEVLTRNSGVVRSVQTLTVPGWIPRGEGMTAALDQAGRLYWQFLRRFGRGLLAVDEQSDGAVTVRALGLPLLAFAQPFQLPDDGAVCLRYPVGRGLGVHPGRRGQGYLQMGLAPGQVSLTVEGYTPSLAVLGAPGRWLYSWTQSPLHVTIARGYLHELTQTLPQGE